MDLASYGNLAVVANVYVFRTSSDVRENVQT